MTVATPTAQSAGVRIRNRALAVAASVVAAVVVWLIADPVLGTDMTVAQEGQEPIVLNAGAFVVATLAAALAGWGLLALLEKFTARGTAIWAGIAVVVLLASFVPVFSVTATTGAKVTLALAHLVVGAVLIPAFWQTRKR